MRTSIVAVAMLLGGCALDEGSNGSGATTVDGTGTPPARTLNVQLGVVDKMGQPVELNHFASPSDVYLTVHAADPAEPVVAEDFVYSVIDKAGELLSSDQPSCRQFQVDDHGNIASVTSMCLHQIARVDGSLLIGVAPFRDATKMTLEITAEDGMTLSVPFVTGP